MEYKILESKGVEIDHIDGAIFNNFLAQNKVGVIKGVGKECNAYALNNTLVVESGLILVRGIRVKITEDLTFSVSGTPAASTVYYLVLKITIKANTQDVLAEWQIRTTQEVRQDSNLYEDSTEEKVFELLFIRFTHISSGNLVNVQKLFLPIEIKELTLGEGGLYFDALGRLGLYYANETTVSGDYSLPIPASLSKYIVKKFLLEDLNLLTHEEKVAIQYNLGIAQSLGSLRSELLQEIEKLKAEIENLKIIK